MINKFYVFIVNRDESMAIVVSFRGHSRDFRSPAKIEQVNRMHGDVCFLSVYISSRDGMVVISTWRMKNSGLRTLYTADP
jgi:hypothetical protein